MLNKYYLPTYAKITMVAMGTFSLVARGKMVAVRDTIFQNLYFQNFLFFFSVGTLIMKVQSNKKCISIKRTIKIPFPLLWQLRFYLRMK